jgi:hypothetical protein
MSVTCVLTLSLLDLAVHDQRTLSRRSGTRSKIPDQDICPLPGLAKKQPLASIPGKCNKNDQVRSKTGLRNASLQDGCVHGWQSDVHAPASSHNRLFTQETLHAAATDHFPRSNRCILTAGSRCNIHACGSSIQETGSAGPTHPSVYPRDATRRISASCAGLERLAATKQPGHSSSRVPMPASHPPGLTRAVTKMRYSPIACHCCRFPVFVSFVAHSHRYFTSLPISWAYFWMASAADR